MLTRRTKQSEYPGAPSASVGNSDTYAGEVGTITCLPAPRSTSDAKSILKGHGTFNAIEDQNARVGEKGLRMARGSCHLPLKLKTFYVSIVSAAFMHQNCGRA